MGDLIQRIFILLAVLIGLLSCDNPKAPEKKIEKKGREMAGCRTFNEDSAYQFIAKQVSFGPRVPNTSNHVKCGDWLLTKLSALGFEVSQQVGEVTAFNGAKLPVRNIIGNFNKNSSKKIICVRTGTQDRLPIEILKILISQ